MIGAVRLPDARIAVGNTATSELRLYDARGQDVRAASRGGAGPGEFEVHAAIVPRIFGTSLIADDESHARVNRYTFAGMVLPQLTFTSSPPAVLSIVEAVAGSQLVARVTASPGLFGAPGQSIVTRY